MEVEKEAPASPLAEEEPGPARALAVHLLRMFQTRVDAAGLAVETELRTFSSRVQFQLLTAAAVFLAVWAGIVLLAIALPPDLRIPVLAGVVGAFLFVAVWAHLAARRAVSSREIGSLAWFVDSLKLDCEALTRSLDTSRAKSPPAAPTQPSSAETARSENSDLAA
jgi:uncharacterized membrane protein YqjE